MTCPPIGNRWLWVDYICANIWFIRRYTIDNKKVFNLLSLYSYSNVKKTLIFRFHGKIITKVTIPHHYHCELNLNPIAIFRTFISDISIKPFFQTRYPMDEMIYLSINGCSYDVTNIPVLFSAIIFPRRLRYCRFSRFISLQSYFNALGAFSTFRVLGHFPCEAFFGYRISVLVAGHASCVGLSPSSRLALIAGWVVGHASGCGTFSK
jgi:hypothetical protein